MIRVASRRYRTWLLTACLCCSFNAFALDFREAYELAKQHDPGWLAAQSESAAGQQARALGRSALLPSLNYRYSRAKNWSEVRQETPLGSTTSDMDYTSYSSSFTLTQPLLDAAAFAQYQAGKAQAQAAELTLERARQALAVQVLQAYTGVLYAHDDIELAKAHLRALQEEHQRSQRFIDYGEGTRTDQLEIAAQARLVEAQLIEAEDRLSDAHNALRALTGTGAPPSSLAPLQTDRLARNVPTPHQESPVLSLEQWHERALVHNPELAAQRSLLEAARHQLNQQRAGHLPNVRLYARSQISDSNSENVIGQRYDTDSIGVEINLPLYSGGRVVAASRQADNTYEQTRHELDAATIELLNDVERQYRLSRSSQQRIEAYQQTVAAATARLEATRKSILGGERTNLDVLNAERERFEALRDLSRARYDYLLAWLTLRWQAGVLNDENISQVAGYF
ncbi:TolC family outer membrane protein [Halomonas sp. SpR8]|uniref:TolC family outer membrane protein n=1 Tax=Halomonas sp. SpR8 TaxID=3050463 RepID=UPI0027E4C4B6|nr:TolC family outer membrane protein [Halomonas sp. SpR8]MDQ7728854.1 TolC family outer membrane protein [Halomonas sp. SpR8]